MAIHKVINGKGPHIVLLHGWCCDLRSMKPIADYLEKNFTLTNIDLPGRGLSDWSDSIAGIDDIADLILPHLPERAIYIGWSFGGLVAISIASRFPDLVERFIGITTAPRFIEDDHWPGVPKPGFSAGFSSIRDVGFVNFFKAFYDAEYKNYKIKPSSYYELIHHLEEIPKTKMDILFNGVAICDATDLRNEYKKLTCQIDLIFGDEDGSVPKLLHPKIQALNTCARLHIISGSQHMPFWTHPDNFFSILDKILKMRD
jgi:pimeloyl-[acyl-carrier protein] methyl ester esterase